MSNHSVAWKYFWLGLLMDAAMLVVAVVLYFVIAAWTYDGKCGLGIIFGSGRHECSFFEYLTKDMMLLPLIIIYCYWWVVLPLLLLPPIAGYLIGLSKLSYK